MSAVAIVGLGYVGLPLAVEFGKQHKTIGFDLCERKVESYRRFVDPTGEISTEALRAATELTVTGDPAALAYADFIIVAVPTPVDAAHQPDFGAARERERNRREAHEARAPSWCTSRRSIRVQPKKCASRYSRSARAMRWRGIFTSATRRSASIPATRNTRLTQILKVVAGDDEETLDRVAALYQSIITAGVSRASSIKVAEAAKVIENTQRDLNIALMNELAILFDRIGIDTLEVLQAAGTKWNFLPFRPGLVGGHCIGVDPVLSHLQGRQDRLSPAGDTRGPAHQRRHGQVHRRADGQAHDTQRVAA